MALSLLRGTAVAFQGLRSIDIENTASAAGRNITDGPAALRMVVLDNQQAAAGNTIVYLKLYDTTKNDWTPGTDKAVIGFPCTAWTSADDSQLAGTYQVMIVNDVAFENGISIAAAKEAGDSSTTAPGTTVTADLILG